MPPSTKLPKKTDGEVRQVIDHMLSHAREHASKKGGLYTEIGTHIRDLNDNPEVILVMRDPKAKKAFEISMNCKTRYHAEVLHRELELVIKTNGEGSDVVGVA